MRLSLLLFVFFSSACGPKLAKKAPEEDLAKTQGKEYQYNINDQEDLAPDHRLYTGPSRNGAGHHGGGMGGGRGPGGRGPGFQGGGPGPFQPGIGILPGFQRSRDVPPSTEEDLINDLMKRRQAMPQPRKEGQKGSKSFLQWLKDLWRQDQGGQQEPSSPSPGGSSDPGPQGPSSGGASPL